MSLINQMLKDLEKRRSRDLETSETLTRNITWENHPRGRSNHWRNLSVLTLLLVLGVLVSFLLWERWQTHIAGSVGSKQTASKQKAVAVAKPVKPKNPSQLQRNTAPAPRASGQDKSVSPQDNESAAAMATATDTVTASSETEQPEENVSPQVVIEKTERPLTAHQRAELSYQEGFQLLQRGSQRQGEVKLRAALEQYPQHVKAREMLAGVYIKAGRYVEAAELLRVGIHLVPGYTLFSKLYARVLLEQKNPQLAIKVLEQQLPAVEVDPDYHALLAATYQRVNNHKQAVEEYLKVVGVQPQAGVWWLGLAISLEKTGKNKEALEAYQRAQETGTLNAGLTKFSNNRVSALKEIGFPD